jgi:hypothetical protein
MVRSMAASKGGMVASVPLSWDSARGHVELGAPAAIAQGFGEFQTGGLIRGAVPSGGQLGLQTAKRNIVRRDFGADTDQHIIARGVDGFDGGAGGLDVASDAAEEIEFPGGVEAAAVQLDVALIAGEAGGCGGDTGLGVQVPGFGGDGGGVVKPGFVPEGAGFAQAGGGADEIEIVGGGGR